MGDIVDLVKDRLVCSELNQLFMLYLDPINKGMPDGATYDTSFSTVPNGIPSIVPPLSSVIQYTASNETITIPSQNIYSINLVVTDNSFQGCISCELKYYLLQVKPLE